MVFHVCHDCLFLFNNQIDSFRLNSKNLRISCNHQNIFSKFIKISVSSKYAKYLRDFPEVKSCVVEIQRDPQVEDMAKAFRLPVRMSSRLLEKTANKKTPCQPKSKSNDLSIAPKSILIAKNRTLGRSKSVTFDAESLPLSVKSSKTVGRKLFGNSLTGSGGSDAKAGTSGLAKSRRASSNESGTANHSSNVPTDATQNWSDAFSNAGNQHRSSDSGLSSGEKLAYESRISALVESNQRKINRIQELVADRDALSNQVASLHRMNRAMAAVIDEYEAEKENDPAEGINK